MLTCILREIVNKSFKEIFYITFIRKKKTVNFRKKLEGENSRQRNGYLGCVKFGMCKVCKGNVYP